MLPSVAYHETDAFCEDEVDFIGADGKAVGHAVNPPQNNDPHYWCTQQIVSSSGKVCPTLETVYKLNLVECKSTGSAGTADVVPLIPIHK